MMNKLRWVMDDGFWDLDMSTPITLDGLARPVPGDPTFPLGLSRGTRLSRPKQIDFFQRFMAAPFVPSYGGRHGFSLQRVLTLPVGDHLYVVIPFPNPTYCYRIIWWVCQFKIKLIILHKLLCFSRNQ